MTFTTTNVRAGNQLDLTRFGCDRGSAYVYECLTAYLSPRFVVSACLIVFECSVRPWYKLGKQLFETKPINRSVSSWTEPYLFAVSSGTAFLGITYVMPFTSCNNCTRYVSFTLIISGWTRFSWRFRYSCFVWLFMCCVLHFSVIFLSLPHRFCAVDAPPTRPVSSPPTVRYGLHHSPIYIEKTKCLV